MYSITVDNGPVLEVTQIRDACLAQQVLNSSPNLHVTMPIPVSVYSIQCNLIFLFIIYCLIGSSFFLNWPIVYCMFNLCIFQTKLTWKRGIAEGTSTHESFRGHSVLRGHESLNGIRFISKHLHSNERLLAFLGEHVPWFGPGQKIADRAL